MGSGARAERIAYGQATGQAKAQLEYEAGQLPILEEKYEIELEAGQKAFEQQLEQIKQMNLLSQELTGGTQPVFVTQAAPATTAAPNYLILIGLGLALYFLFFR